MTDQNRKTLRSFYCRDYLWQEFEGMTRDLGCSMDYLINEAMRQYARSRDVSPQGAQPVVQSQSQMPQYQAPAQVPATPVPVQRPSGPMPQRPSGPMPQRPSVPMPQRPAAPAPPRQPAPVAQPLYQQAPPVRQAPPMPAARPVAAATPQPQQAQAVGHQYGQQSAQASLYLLFNGQRYRIDKEQFVIGRGSQQTDLTIRDGNISRKHCVVVQRGGHYFIQDLGSTNGIEFNGKRVEHKRIEEGDTFYLCDYELRFSYR